MGELDGIAADGSNEEGVTLFEVRLPSHHYHEPQAWMSEFLWLAIVGSRTFKNPNGMAIAENIVYQVLDSLEGHVDWNRFGITSGHAEGVDTIAETVAEDCWYRKAIYPPKNKVWEPEGFKERNEYIGQTADWMVAIRCEGAKSWGTGHAAEHAESLGKSLARFVIHNNEHCSGCATGPSWKTQCQIPGE